MGRRRAPDVVFDWTGSLEVARLAWATAEQLESVMAGRRTSAAELFEQWHGPSAAEFGALIDDELRAVEAVAGALRNEATAWAIEWTKAVDQDNYNRYQDACQRARDSGGALDWLGDQMFGEDDLPAQPAPATTPRPPSFAATASFAHY